MGCKQSTQQPGRRRGTNGGAEVAFGNGVHIGRAGNIDLCRRNLDFLGVDMVRVITTDELHRQATSLSLTDNKLYVLGREMLLLPELEELDVDGNRLQRIPEILTKLPKLWRINASMNPLDAGNGFAVLHQLKALRSLALRDCALKHLPRGILDCTTLEELDLSGNAEIRLQGKDLTGLPNLRKLSVAHCGLGGNQLPLCIRKLNSLVMLDISANDYHMDAANFFGPHLARSLTELHLRDLNLTAVPQVIITLKNLRELDLGGNPIETLDVLAGRIVKRIPRATTAAANNSNSNNNNIVPTSSAPPEYRADDPLQLSPLSFSGAGDVAGVVPPTTTTTTDDGACADGEADVEEDNISINSFNSHASSRQSMSKVSKIGVISSVAQPLPVKKLSLRGCDLRTVPKYFHKMTSLEELDLSENENLDDANMTLFSLHNLRVLNIVGCPFADDTSRSRNEWFDIAKLRNLVEIHWELWKGAHNVSPYRTCIPIELCGLSLQRINEVALRPDLFVGETAETVIQLMRDGYYKINLGIDENLISSHVNALNAFLPAEKFFFPDDTPYATGAELSELNVNISISRYIFFLAMQAANYDAVIIPPIDVMIVHYAQLTLDPVKYRADCEAVCNRVLNCNYRTFFREQIRHVAAARDSIGASKKVWNMMVRSAQRDLEWLRYNFWDRRAHALCGSATEDATSASSPTTNRRGGGGPSTSSSVLQSLPHAPFTASEEVLKQSVQELRAHDSQQDLAAVLDQAITSHFMEQGNGAIRTSLQQFFRVGRALVNQCDASGDKISLDWSTYVKYMALFAYRIAQRKDGGAGSSSGGSPSALVEPAASSVSDDASPTYAAMMPMKRASKLGPRYDTLEEPEHNPIPPEAYLPLPDATASPPQRGLSSLAVPRRTISALSAAASSKDRNALDKRRAAIRQLSVNPIPTTGITLLLHAHRTSHLKYYQTLSLFGIEDTDIDWGSSPQALEQTKRAWGALYEEEYVGGFDLKCSGSGPRNGSTRSTRGGGAAASSSSASACRSLYDPFSSDARNTNFTYCADAPLPECGGTKHTQRDRNARHVTFTCGDSTAGFSEPSL